MYTNNHQRIGYACKTLHPDQTLPKKLLETKEKPLREMATTVAWLNRQKREVAEQKLWDCLQYNSASLLRLVEYVGNLEPSLRMLRISSNQLPVYTENTWSYFWQTTDVQNEAERLYSRVGEEARKLDIRLSMHPGQFCCLASDNPDVVERSIAEFEYHADLIRWMGYGKRFQDFKCNVHLSGKLGADGFLKSYSKLSPEARNTITIENDEYTSGVEDILQIKDTVPLVLDIHHHLIHSNGEYIMPDDDRFQKIIESWRGVRPVIHYSVSREDLLEDHDVTVLPDIPMLIENGFKKAKLRAHSDMMWNDECNKWAYKFWKYADIMTEAKHKNLASKGLYEFFKNNFS